MERKYEQCTRCVMDTTDADIWFDELGHCNHCNEFVNNTIKKTYQGAISDSKLSIEIEKIKKLGQGKKYDCVVGISGGADSCYTAYMCKQLGLRLLLVHIDNGWDSETSVKNVEMLCKFLDVDYVSKVLDWESFKDIQLSHLKASVPEIETPTDIALLEELHLVAAEYDVKYLVMGGNYITEGILAKTWHYNPKDKKYSLGIHKKFSKKKTSYFPSFDFPKELYYKFFKGIKILYLLNYVPFNKKLAIESLEKIGWSNYGEKHHESIYTKIVQSYILPLKFNIDYRKATLSTKICVGEISREEALKIISSSTYNKETIEADISYLCKKLGFSREEFEAMMREKPKSHLEYPNNQFLLEFLYKLYQCFQKK